MTYQQDIDLFNVRIAKAESQRDAWRSAGLQEKFLEAYFLVEGLRLQLEERVQQHDAELPTAEELHRK